MSITQRLLREAEQFDRLVHPERFASTVARGFRLSRAARVSLLAARAAAAAGGVLLAPEAALLAGTALVGTAAYKAAKFARNRKASLALPIPLPKQPTPAPKMPKRKAGDQGGNPSKRRKIDNGGGMVSRPITVPIAGGQIITRPRAPRFMSTNGSTIVINSETIVNMTSAALGAFSTFNLPLISGLPPWLAGLGDLFSKWRWRDIEVIYVPSCPTTTSGKVCMALSYDRLDAPPVSFANLTQNYRAITFPVYAGFSGSAGLSGPTNSNTMCVRGDVTRFEKPWYSNVANAAFAALPANVQNQYCPATIHVAVEGGPAAATIIGDLYFKYTIEFIEPINPTMNA